MTIKELLVILHELPVSALDMDVFLGMEDEELMPIKVEPITESCDDPTVIGYVLCQDRQLDLPFDKDMN